MLVNYKQLKECIADKVPYVHGSSHASYVLNNDYAIYSYDTLIAVINTHGDVTYYNDNHYSSTTSKLQNIIKSAYDVAGWLAIQAQYIEA